MLVLQSPIAMRGLLPGEELLGEALKASVSLGFIWWRFWFGQSGGFMPQAWEWPGTRIY